MKINRYLYQRSRDMRRALRRSGDAVQVKGRAPFQLLPVPLTRRQWKRLAEVELDRRYVRNRMAWPTDRTLRPPTPQQRRAFLHGVALFLDGRWPPGNHPASASSRDYSVRSGWAWAINTAEKAGDPLLLNIAALEVDGRIPIPPNEGGRAYYHTWPGMAFGGGGITIVEHPDAQPVLPPPPAWLPPSLSLEEQAVYIALLSHTGSDTRWLERARRGRTDSELRADVGAELGSTGSFGMPWADVAVGYEGSTNPENSKPQRCSIKIDRAPRGWYPPFPKEPGEWRPYANAHGQLQTFSWLISPGGTDTIVKLHEDSIVGIARKLFAIPYPDQAGGAPVAHASGGQLALF